MDKWIKKYFSEQWEDISKPNIDFSKIEPTDEKTSLHVLEHIYKVGDETYKLLYALGEDEPIYRRLLK